MPLILQSVRTLLCVEAPRAGAPKVGKFVAGQTYVHRSAEDTLPGDLLSAAKKRLPDGYSYDYVRYNPKDGSFGFMQCPEFDSAHEPAVTGGMVVRGDQVTTTRIPGKDKQIIHGKHLMVKPGYGGFDREAARARWDSYSGDKHLDRNRMGWQSWWERYCADNRLEDPAGDLGGQPGTRKKAA